MTFEEIVSKVESVTCSALGKAKGLCPAHLDTHPSLSLRAVEDRVLIRCFAGCTPQAICSALGIDMADLFVEPKGKMKEFQNGHNKPSTSPNVSPFHTSKLLRQYANKLLDIADGFALQSHQVIEQARGMGIHDWTPEDLDGALAIVDRAQQKQRLVAALDDLAGTLKTCAMDLERKHDASRPRKTR